MTAFFLPPGSCSVWGTANANVGFHIQEDLREWLEDNEVDFRITFSTEEIDRWTQMWKPVIVFTDDTQAMLFKLTWL